MNDSLCFTSRDDATTVDYHRHCQATVLSANGTGNQNGATWSVINNLDLPSIQTALQRLSYPNSITSWKGYFTRNTGNSSNITYDLASILQLINYGLQDASSRAMTITFNDWGDSLIDSVDTHPFTLDSPNYTFKLGQTINITINSQTAASDKISFHTTKNNGTTDFNVDLDNSTIKLKIDDYETSFNAVVGANSGVDQDQSVSIPLPKKSISITKNGVTKGTVSNIYMNSANDATIDVSDNFVALPATDKVVYSTSVNPPTSTITPDYNSHIYYLTATNSFKLIVNWANISSYYENSTHSGSGDKSNVVDFEVHIKNTSSTVNITVYGLPGITETLPGTDTAVTNQGTALTDNTTVAAGKTNVYVIRRHPSSTGASSAIVHSLAYIY